MSKGGKVTPTPQSVERASADEGSRFVRRHLIFGWWCVLVFLTFGLVLESFHGLKIAWYVNVSGSARRLMWTLAHAHGTLLGLLNLGFSWTLRVGAVEERSRGTASACLIGASIVLPGGFFLGGFGTYGGDPGLGVYLSPVGGLLLVVAVGTIVRGLRSPRA